MKRFREVVQSIYAPEDKNVLWLDISISDQPILKYYSIDEWISVAGGGGPSPTPTRLKYTYYYGALDTRQTNETIDLSNLNYSNLTSVSSNFNKIYFYIALTNDQSINSIITMNQENITSQFNNIGSFIRNGVQYTLYEFFLDTLIPLDVTATIRINGNTI